YLRRGNLQATRDVQDAGTEQRTEGRRMRGLLERLGGRHDADSPRTAPVTPGGISVIKRFMDGMKAPDRRRVFYAILGGKAVGLGLLLLIIAGIPAYFGHKAFADDAPPPAYVNPINTMWVCVTAFLVFFMQAGFMFLEAGFARTRETVNVL